MTTSAVKTVMTVASRPDPVDLPAPSFIAATVTRVSTELAALDDPDDRIRRRLWNAYSKGYDTGVDAAVNALRH